MNKHTFHVAGTHCGSCKILIEDILRELDIVDHVQVHLQSETVEIQTDSELTPHELAQVLTRSIQSNGYSLSIERRSQKEISDDTIWKAIPIGLGFLIAFFFLQRSGILNFGIGGQISPTSSFLIGLVASVSSCLTIVGGLVLSLSAKVSQDTVSDTKTFWLFHVGRVFGFAILGGMLGFVGSALGVNFTLTAILGLITSIVMIILGLQLVGVFAKNSINLPPGLFKFLRRIEHKSLTPLSVGIGTFFLPCGFTQSMQVAALASGSFLSGSLIMLSFALGTLPMLVLLSFGSVSISHSRHAPIFFKTAGIVVVGFGIVSLLAGMAGLGIIRPLFSF